MGTAQRVPHVLGDVWRSSGAARLANRIDVHIDPNRGLWVEPVCGCAPIELLDAGEEELERDRAEAIRVAYVAATRARDLLVAPVCGDQRIEGWLEVLDSVLYPPTDSRRKPDLAPACPTFGEDSVLDRGPQGEPPAEDTVRPGLHRPQADGPPVVWWDPAVLTLEVEEQAALRHQRILEVDSEGVAAATSEENYAAWKSEWEALLHRASQPSIVVQTATSRARTEEATVMGREVKHAERSVPVAVEILPRSELQRPSGRRFGALVHAVLSTLDLDASADALEASAAINGRLVGAMEDEIQAAIQIVGAACGHPVLRRAAISANKGQLRRETPVMMRLEDGTLVEGVVDLAFREDTADFAGWTVVDFKTDREFDKSSSEYISQVRIYAEAVAAATNAPARGVLLVI